MKIKSNFDEHQIELLENAKIDISKDFDNNSLEELEDKVYNLMMNHLDKNQDFTPKSEEWEKILDIIVDIENNL